jgi:hypothetical protein
MLDDIIQTEERRSPLNHRCPRCRVGHEHPTIHIIWRNDGSIAQWYRCGCGALNPTRLAIEPIIL